MIKIDLRAIVIPEGTRVWRLFPGQHYKFLGPFQDLRAAFLDVPGLELPEGPIADARDLSNRLRRSEITIEKIRQDGREAIPVITAAELKDFRVGKKRQRHQQAVINFFGAAAVGDLIVVPDKLSEGRILIGRFSGPDRSPIIARAPALYGPVPIPARRVEWLGYFPENKISTALSKALRNEYPFSLIERSLFLEVFSLAYSSYVYREQHSATIYNTKDDYLDLETSLLGLVSGIAARISEKVDNGDDEEVDIIDAIFDPASIEYHCSLASDIHSEGFNRFTASKFTPLVIAAFIAALSVLSGCDSQAELAVEREKVVIVNSSAPPDDLCTANVSKTTLLMIQNMDIDRLWKTCQNMKDAERRAGLRSSAVGHR